MLFRKMPVLLICIYITLSACEAPPPAANTPSERLGLEALKKAGRWANPDVAVLGSLVNQFTVRGLAEEGHRYFSELESTHGEADHYPVILAASALMQVQNNESVSLLKRKKFVRAGIQKLDDAVALDDGLPRYFGGTLLVNIPTSFDETQRGIDDLRAVLDTLESMPLDVERGAWRELARGLEKMEDPAAAEALARSGHVGSEDETTILGSLSVTPESGLRFTKEGVRRAAEGIFVAQGFDMTDIAFIESDAGLIVVDAGTRPENAAAAFTAVSALTAQSPSQLLITHAHWDHIGGASAFADIPATATVGFDHEVDIGRKGASPLPWLFGEAPVDLSFEPTLKIDAPQVLSSAQRSLELIPVQGGESNDYWAADGEGIETMSAHDWARALDILGGGEAAYINAAEKLLDAGDAAIPLQLVKVGLVNFGESEKLLELQRRCRFRLRGLNQQMNVFKVVHHSERMGTPLKSISPSSSSVD